MNRLVMWSATSWPGTEHLEIREGQDEIEVDGLVVAQVDGVALRLAYRIECDPDWTTRRVELSGHGAASGPSLRSDGKGRWTDDAGAEVAELAGCMDVDIAVTPFTNSLPIRRLPWVPGQVRELLMVYLAVPEMTVRPARQRYTCLETGEAGATFRYESGSFRRDLQVDPDGLVTDYPGFWRRLGV